MGTQRTAWLTVTSALLGKAGWPICNAAGPELLDRRRQHGLGHGHTTRVSADGTYRVTLAPGSYSVIGGLSGSPGGPVAETCSATINVVVTADSTTRADYVCDATPATSP